MDYDFMSIKSNYVKEKLLNGKNTVKHREYIGSLIRYEQYILGKWKPIGLHSGHFYLHITESKDFAMIQKELDPIAHKKFLLDRARDLAEKRAEAKEHRQFEKEEKLEKAKEKASFEKALKSFKKKKKSAIKKISVLEGTNIVPEDGL